MEEKKKFSPVKFGIFLGVLGVLVAAILATVNHFTKPIIDKRIEEAKQKSLIAVNNEYTWKEMDSSNTNISEKFGAYDGDDLKIVSYTIDTMGYGNGNIKSMTFIENGKILKYKILSMKNQTPDIGSKIGEDDFLNKFTGKNVVDYAQKTVDDREVDTISGATISSNGAIKAIIIACDDYYKNHLTNKEVIEPKPDPDKPDPEKPDPEKWLDNEDLKAVNNEYKWKELSDKTGSMDKKYGAFEEDELKIIAYSLKTKGYGGGKIESLIFIQDGKILEYKILSMKGQTPGIGSRINEPEYLNKFKGRDILKDYHSKKLEDCQSDVISSATISSNAVIKALFAVANDYNVFHK